jgi:hypothetical protein
MGEYDGLFYKSITLTYKQEEKNASIDLCIHMCL